MSESSPQKKSGWGSVWSSAVSSLESRLDTILAEDSDASTRVRLSDIAEAKERAEAEAEAARLASRKATLAAPVKDTSREASRSRASDRLAERLARATAAKKAGEIRSESASASAAGSRTESPAVAENERRSGEEKRSAETARSVPGGDETAPPRVSDEQAATPAVTEESKTDSKPTEDNTAPQALAGSTRLSTESSTRPSLSTEHSPGTSTDLPNGTSSAPTTTSTNLEAELTNLREEQTHRQEELHTYLEKIDALQAKLTYLATQTVQAAKEANASAASTATEKQLAEKDEQIAQLMQEGETLSKTELRHLQTIKKLRSAASEGEKAALETKKRLDRTEQSEKELRSKLRRSETAERQASDKAKQISVIEKQVAELQTDRENAAELVRNLTIQLKEAKEATTKAEREAKEKATSEADKARIASLENELEDAQIERKLAQSRAETDVRQLREEGEGREQRFAVRELELKNEIAVLESRVEAMRSRAEEAVSGEVSAAPGATGTGGESLVGLLRQVETLQSSYAAARENWETIEGSLQSRLAVLEGERDESLRREAEARKKVREVGGKARRVEEEVEGFAERVRGLEEELKVRVQEATELQEKCLAAEGKFADAQAELKRERRAWEEEKMKWQQRGVHPNLQQQQQQQALSRNGSPGPSFAAPHSRKTSLSNTDALRRPHSSRLTSYDLATLRTDIPSQQRSGGRRSSGFPTPQLSGKPFSPSPPPVLNRQDSTFSAGIPPTPSIEIENSADDNDYDPDMMVQTPTLGPTHSPDRTVIADLVSTTTSQPAAGPSVQLIERLTTSIRRLESEKAASKDEFSRLTAQRDAARDEIVSLMREVEVKRTAEERVEALGKELGGLRGRYEASLEMLGEREEEVEELRSDVGELKRLYRELVDERMGGVAGPGGGAVKS